MKTAFILPFRQRRRLNDRALRAQARDQREVCGALIATSACRLELRFLANRADRPGKFSMRQADFAAVQASLQGTEWRLVGSFHSHPVGHAMPGPRDLRANRFGSLMLIYDVCAREPRLWRLGRRGRSRVAIEVPLVLGRTGKPSQQPSNHRVNPPAGVTAAASATKRSPAAGYAER